MDSGKVEKKASQRMAVPSQGPDGLTRKELEQVVKLISPSQGPSGLTPSTGVTPDIPPTLTPEQRQKIETASRLGKPVPGNVGKPLDLSKAAPSNGGDYSALKAEIDNRNGGFQPSRPISANPPAAPDDLDSAMRAFKQSEEGTRRAQESQGNIGVATSDMPINAAPQGGPSGNIAGDFKVPTAPVAQAPAAIPAVKTRTPPPGFDQYVEGDSKPPFASDAGGQSVQKDWKGKLLDILPMLAQGAGDYFAGKALSSRQRNYERDFEMKKMASEQAQQTKMQAGERENQLAFIKAQFDANMKINQLQNDFENWRKENLEYPQEIAIQKNNLDNAILAIKEAARAGFEKSTAVTGANMPNYLRVPKVGG